MKLKVFLLAVLMSLTLQAQDKVYSSRELSVNTHIDGTILLPNDIVNPPLAILIADSGPTDRNGNQNFLKNNSLKKLAESLSAEGIATFRYDKRIVKQIRKGNVDPNIMFDDFVTDAISVLNYFKNSNSFSAIHIIGHSQGSLVGMIAAQHGADGFISLAGAGKSIDKVIIDQIENTAPMFNEDTKRVFSILKEGKTTDDFPPALASIFKKDVQPFMSNWMQYDPQLEIKKLAIPILLINGTKDLQVVPEEAKLLESAVDSAQLEIIENMNHILVSIEGDSLDNSKSYNDPMREITPKLIEVIVKFIL
jgi:alpha/beta superfamily hydrolase